MPDSARLTGFKLFSEGNQEHKTPVSTAMNRNLSPEKTESSVKTKSEIRPDNVSSLVSLAMYDSQERNRTKLHLILNFNEIITLSVL